MNELNLILLVFLVAVIAYIGLLIIVFAALKDDPSAAGPSMSSGPPASNLKQPDIPETFQYLSAWIPAYYRPYFSWYPGNHHR